MSKRIYIPGSEWMDKLKDPRTLAAVTEDVGIKRDRLEKAARGEVELTSTELAKLKKFLG